jgi:hypothetical protein
MAQLPTVLAYFGPEVQLPVISLIGSIVGLAMMVGSLPIRLIRERVRRWRTPAATRENGM